MKTFFPRPLQFAIFAGLHHTRHCLRQLGYHIFRQEQIVRDLHVRAVATFASIHQLFYHSTSAHKCQRDIEPRQFFSLLASGAGLVAPAECAFASVKIPPREKACVRPLCGPDGGTPLGRWGEPADWVGGMPASSLWTIAPRVKLPQSTRTASLNSGMRSARHPPDPL